MFQIPQEQNKTKKNKNICESLDCILIAVNKQQQTNKPTNKCEL